MAEDRDAPVVQVGALVQVLLDEREITELLFRYATALDTRDWDLLRSCFLPDAVAVYDGIGECDGYQSIEDVCRAALTPLSCSQHLIGNVHVVVDEHEASAHCYLQAQHVNKGTDGGDLFIVAGRYSDSLVRTEDGWRIAHRRLETWWTDGNPAVVSA